jgi:hypothetical protein
VNTIGEEGSLDGDMSQGIVPADDINKGVAGVRGGGEDESEVSGGDISVVVSKEDEEEVVLYK